MERLVRLLPILTPRYPRWDKSVSHAQAFELATASGRCLGGDTALPAGNQLPLDQRSLGIPGGASVGLASDLAIGSLADTLPLAAGGVT